MNFLRSRTQVTKVSCHVFQCVSLTSGVVQGSCLGPFCFLVYFNALVAVFNANVTPKLYADDLKLDASLSCPCSVADFQKNSTDLLCGQVSDSCLTLLRNVA